MEHLLISEPVEIVLTDDEVLAAAQPAERAWTRFLPTVDTTDSKEVLRSVARGFRSLALRGLIDDESPDAEGLRLPAEVSGESPWAMAMAVTSEITPLAGAERVEIFTDGEEDSITVLTLPSGVHYFRRSSKVQALDLLADLAVDGQVADAADSRLAILLRDAEGQPARGYLLGSGVVGLQPAGAEWDESTTPEIDGSRDGWLGVFRALWRPDAHTTSGDHATKAPNDDV